jgi:hypothetical protein
MVKQERAINLPWWWSGDVELTSKRLREEIKKRNFPSNQEGLIFEAMDIANQYHAHQERANGEKYVIHAYRVALSLFLEFEESSVELVTAALLHDLLEDTTYTRQQMEEKFGANVAQLVDAISREEDEKRPKQGDQITDKYFRKILESGVDSIKLKVADKLDNIRDALNHPKLEKRRIYIRECQTVFLPLLKYLENPALEKKLHGLIEEAMLNHPSYIDQLLLFNPGLDYWIASDHVQRVKIPLNPGFTSVDLVKSVAASIINRINNNQLDSLLYIANLPEFLNSPGKKNSWDRVKTQLTLLVELLSMDRPPQWLTPIMETPGYLLAVVHSKLFMPANWLFPLWQKDYGDHILKSNKKLYLSIYASETRKTEKWIVYLHLSLIHRAALWRFITGNGVHTAKIILSEIKRAVQSYGKRNEYSLMVSMRLLSEYLDIKTDSSVSQEDVERKFLKLWGQLNNPDETISAKVDEKVEIIGFEKIRDICPRLKTNLSYLRYILMESINLEMGNDTATARPQLVWINFNVSEIEKRLTFFQKALKKIDSTKTFKDLNKIGIHVQIDQLENVLVFTVEPDKWDALKNRIPEITDKEREEIRTNQYSAAAIFDTLIKNKLGIAEQEPLWIPRVYRILDTMADFDPTNVQPITITFQAEENIKDVKVYLPILKEVEDRKLQEKRKDITARYIVILIYNYVVTLGIYSASVDCSPLEEQKIHLGFKNDELESLIYKFSKQHGYEQKYGIFLENFNFKKFSIKSALSPREDIQFTGKDITAYGTFLGIDIGGTDIKVSLFRKGEVAFKKNQLLKFKTIDPTIGNVVPVEKFCQRIIKEVEKGFNNTRRQSNFHWKEIDGIGISWPGAVRNSKIIAFSPTLQRLSFQKDDKTKILHAESSPQDIHSLDLAGVFTREIKKKCKNLSDSFVVTLENDGNAEAYGNYCHLTKNNKQVKTQQQVPGGKIIIKLGTSLAGGHVNAYGAISPYMAEFSKITLDFNTKGEGGGVQGVAREFVSSKGVRNLSRTFTFNQEPVFGELVCKCCRMARNAADSQETRVEAVEIGKMLNLFKHLDDGLKTRFYQELVDTDNQSAAKTYKKTMNTLVTQLKKDEKMKQELRQYIQERGEAEFNRLDRNSKTSKSKSLVWQLGISRLRLLLQLEPSTGSYETGQIPGDLDYKILAKKILSSVALLSQLGAHISHLIVALYNILKKERFSEVILAGGVLSGESGPLVIRQAEAFLVKYYDKIFGWQKHLKPGSVRLAIAVENPDTVGPFGAAMVANRFHKMNSLAVMEKEVDYRVRSLKPGDTLSLKDLQKTFRHLRVKKEDILTYLESLISKSVLLQQSTEKEIYVKSLNPG